MKRIASTLTLIGILTVFSTSAKAADNYFGLYVTARNHASDHAVLNHRAQHRAVQQHNADHYPTTRYQHTRTHARLNHQAAHDRAQHRAAHDSHAYSPAIVYGRGLGHGGHGRGGFSIRTPRLSVVFGH